jgi:hypothetical protein
MSHNVKSHHFEQDQRSSRSPSSYVPYSNGLVPTGANKEIPTWQELHSRYCVIVTMQRLSVLVFVICIPDLE